MTITDEVNTKFGPRAKQMYIHLKKAIQVLGFGSSRLPEKRGKIDKKEAKEQLIKYRASEFVCPRNLMVTEHYWHE